jgi:lipopolysaccharide transport system ATP-binding protein
MSNDVVIQVEQLSKHYKLGVINHGTLYRDIQSWWARYRGRPDPNVALGGWTLQPKRVEGDLFRALENISFSVKRGEVLGVIGGNGAGKSTLLKVLSRITAPTSGIVKLKGRVASLLEVGTGFHPELTGRENIFLNGTILGMSSAEVAGKFDEIVEFAEIGDFIDTPVKRYSSGMYVRLAFSVAAHLESDILIVDEVLAVGDISFQKKCIGKMESVSSGGRTVLFVSHNMASIESLCTKSLVLKDGHVEFFGGVKEGVRHYHSFFETASKDGLNLETAQRSGNGRLKIVDLWFADEKGARLAILKTGQFIKLNICLESQVSSNRNVVLAVGITTIRGEGVLHLSTETSGLEISHIDKEGLLTCHLRLPLRGGLYSMNLFLTCNGIVSDWIQDAFRFQVEDADFYGTGKLPPDGYSHYINEFNWTREK